MSPAIGIVIPTLGSRPEYLQQCISSVRLNAPVHVCLVGPESLELEPFRALCDSFVTDPGRGLAAAINTGIASLPESVELVNWLGDDDLLSADGLHKLAAAIAGKGAAKLAYGHCQYIDGDGAALFTVRSSRWAEVLMRFGPQLISQPAMLFQRDAFRQVGGLDEQLGWAFDLDLLIKLSRLGRFRSVSGVTASYRWHDGALTVASRQGSVREASLVRVRHLHPVMRTLSWSWEPLVRVAITKTAKLVTRKFQKL
jgi:GT2 family glycosyltransferase